MEIKKMLSGKMKGQAIMEYFMTYGVALFVILIVLALIISNIDKIIKPPEACTFTQPGFSCNQKTHAIVSDPNTNVVDARFQLDNAQGSGVVIKGILCINEGVGNIQKSQIQPLGTEIKLNAGQSKEFTVICKTADGSDLTLSPSSNFKGSLAFLYKFQNDISNAPDRIAIASLTGNVQ